MAAAVSAAGNGALSVRRWSIDEWLAAEHECNELAARAGSDALFLSWDWLTNWWHFYGDSLGRSPLLLAFYRGTQLAGLAPLYRRAVRRSGVLPTHSVQMIGLAWRERRPLISEYLDVIAPAGELEPVRAACVRELLAEGGWSEFVIGFTAAGEGWRRSYEGSVGGGGHYVRELDRAVTYQADLAAGFEAYLRDLRQSTRRSLWNLRRRLAGEGAVELETLSHEKLEEGFADLNRLHRLRWHKPAFGPERLAVHMRLARRLAARGELALSRLRVGGAVVSVLYDVRKGGHQYNIKMGFDPAFSSRISLGLIHFGYAMEEAAAAGVQRYDFLAGPGRTSDFKRLLSQTRRELSCVQMLRGPWVSALYRWRDRVRGPG